MKFGTLCRASDSLQKLLGSYAKSSGHITQQEMSIKGLFHLLLKLCDLVEILQFFVNYAICVF